MASELHADRARIYVSFADEDRARAMQLVRWLNDSGWRVTADDRHSFAADEHWTPTPRLELCDVILCVITPGWLVSDFCRQEYSYCAKRGRFVLPVICELPDVELPPALRALPRVDLTQDRMIDYLALKQVLTQAGSRIARAALASEASGQRSHSTSAAEDKGLRRWLPRLWARRLRPERDDPRHSSLKPYSGTLPLLP